MTKNQIQIMRGIAIIMVVVHHVLSNIDLSKFSNIIYYFNRIHVVVFFIISGYLFQANFIKYKERGALNFVTKKFKSLGVPYIFWTMLLYIGVKLVSIIPKGVYIISKMGFYPLTFSDMIINTLTFKSYYVQVLWFVYVLFWILLINYTIKEDLVNMKFTLLFIGISIILNISFDLPFIVAKLVKHLPNFIVGRYLFIKFNDIKKYLTIKNIYIVFFIVIILNIIDCINRDNLIIDIYSEIISYITGWAGCFIIIYISTLIERSNIGKYLLFIGDNSYLIYLMHHPYITGIFVLIMKKINIYVPIIACISIFFALTVPIFINKTILSKSKEIRELAGGIS